MFRKLKKFINFGAGRLQKVLYMFFEVSLKICVRKLLEPHPDPIMFFLKVVYATLLRNAVII